MMLSDHCRRVLRNVETSHLLQWRHDIIIIIIIIITTTTLASHGNVVAERVRSVLVRSVGDTARYGDRQAVNWASASTLHRRLQTRLHCRQLLARVTLIHLTQSPSLPAGMRRIAARQTARIAFTRDQFFGPQRQHVKLIKMTFGRGGWTAGSFSALPQISKTSRTRAYHLRDYYTNFSSFMDLSRLLIIW